MSKIQDGGSKDGKSEAAMPCSSALCSSARMWLKLISGPSRPTPPPLVSVAYLVEINVFRIPLSDQDICNYVSL